MRPALACQATVRAGPAAMAWKPVAMPPHITAQCRPPSRPAVSAASRVGRSPASVMAMESWRRRAALAWPPKRRGRAVVVLEDVEGRRVEVVELAALDRPHEGGDGRAQQHQADRDQQQQDPHARASPDIGEPALSPLAGSGACRARRKALRVTSSEDRAMPRAAIQGVTRPAAASGIASTL